MITLIIRDGWATSPPTRLRGFHKVITQITRANSTVLQDESHRMCRLTVQSSLHLRDFDLRGLHYPRVHDFAKKKKSSFFGLKNEIKKQKEKQKEKIGESRIARAMNATVVGGAWASARGSGRSISRGGGKGFSRGSSKGSSRSQVLTQPKPKEECCDCV